MKEDMVQKIVAVLNALNNITVSGKNNLANLSGSIAVLEELVNTLSAANIPVDVSEGK